jgi:hypothetical protein
VQAVNPKRKAKTSPRNRKKPKNPRPNLKATILKLLSSQRLSSLKLLKPRNLRLKLRLQ